MLGSKNIKAVAVQGSQLARWAHADELVAAWPGNLSDKSFGPATAKCRELGTAANLLLFNRLGALADAEFSIWKFRRGRGTVARTIEAQR